MIDSLGYLDWVIIFILTVSSVISIFRGFVKEALSLATWVTAFIIARLFVQHVDFLLAEYLTNAAIRYAVSFAILFLSTLIVGAIINNLFHNVIKKLGLSGLDRFLGVAFGLIRGALIIVVALAILRLVLPMEQYDWWNHSVLAPHFLLIDDWIRKTIPPLIGSIMNSF